MKLASYRGARGGVGVGAVARDHVFNLDDEIAALALPDAVLRELDRRAMPPAASGMLRLLQAGGEALRSLAEVIAQRVAAGVAGPEESALSEVELLAPVPRPGKVVAIGRNYADHAKETGTATLEQPRIIAKLPSSVVGPNARSRGRHPCTSSISRSSWR